MKAKISIVILVTVFAVLIFAMQNSFLLAGGSEAGETIVAPGKISQWLALFLFALLALFPASKIPLVKRHAVTLKATLLAVSTVLLLASGHTYRYSDRAHAFIDTWYFVPLQTLEIDPTQYLENAQYHSGPSFLSISTDGHTRQRILTRLGPFGIDEKETIDLLQNFGFQQQIE